MKDQDKIIYEKKALLDKLRYKKECGEITEQ